MYPLRRADLKSTLLPDGYLVIVDEAASSAITLNPLGAAIWEFCDGTHSIADITAELHELIGSEQVPPALEDRVNEMLAELAKGGLVSQA